MVSVPRVGESGADAVQQIPRSMLIGIIQPRIEETLELVRDQLQASGLARTAGRRAVLTGGAALLTGVREHAARVLDKQVRVGRPLGVHGLAEATEGPAFASAAGLLVYAGHGPGQQHIELMSEATIGAGRIHRLGRWFKENF
jgi:cell division protein FtsA